MYPAPHDPIAPFSPRPPQARGSQGTASAASALNMKWLALHDAASVIATLAGEAARALTADERNFPAAMRDAGGWRRQLAEQGVEDLSVIMQTGLTALLAVNARGTSPLAPARALWDEYLSARTALLALNLPDKAGLRPLG